MVLRPPTTRLSRPRKEAGSEVICHREIFVGASTALHVSTTCDEVGGVGDNEPADGIVVAVEHGQQLQTKGEAAETAAATASGVDQELIRRDTRVERPQSRCEHLRRCGERTWP